MTLKVLLPRMVTFADQVLSSVSNVLVIFLVAPVVSAGDFGRFALGYTILTLTLTASRTYFGTRVSLAPDHDSAVRLTENVLAALVLLAPPAAVVVFALSALATGGQSLDLLLIVALATPIVCMQDIIRFGAAASGRPWTAVASDGLWVAVMAMPLLLRMRLSPMHALLRWAAGAVAALVVAWVGMRLRPRLRDGMGEVTRHDVVGRSITPAYVGSGVASLWTLAFVAHTVDAAASGSLAGASKAMGPINVLFSYIALGVTPVLVRRNRSSDLRFCASTGVVMAGVILLWGALLLALPRSVGTTLFGDSWDGVRGVLPWIVAEYAFLAVSTASGLGLRVRGHAGALIRQRVAATVVTVVGGSTVAVLTHEAWAVAAALAAAALTSAVVGWGPLWRRTVIPASQRPLGDSALLPMREI